MNPRTLKFKPGQKVGRWTIIGRGPKMPKHAYWKVRCECGNESLVQACQLGTRSLGCRTCHLKHLRRSGITAPTPAR